MNLWQRFKAWAFGLENFSTDEIIAPLTRIRDALAQHSAAAHDAAADAHDAADVLRSQACDFYDKAQKATRHALALDALFGTGAKLPASTGQDAPTTGFLNIPPAPPLNSIAPGCAPNT